MIIAKPKEYLQIINLLRGLAAFMVAFFHFSSWGDWENGFYQKDDFLAKVGSHGNMGVYIFFVISGFVIPYSLIKNQYRLRNFFQFILKRSTRIEIPYLVTIGLFILVQYWYHVQFGNPFFIGLKRLCLHFFYLIPFSDYKWISVIFWTLGVEFQFYLVIAVLILLFTHTNKWVQTLSLLAFVFLNFFDLLRPDFSFIYSHTGIFSIGIVTCLFYLKRIDLWQVILIALLGFSITWYIKGWEIPTFALFTALAIYFLNFSGRIGTFMGNISYSLYLTHALIGNNLIFLVLKIWKWNISNHILLGLALGLSILFAWLFWWLIERPSKQLASKITIGNRR